MTKTKEMLNKEINEFSVLLEAVKVKLIDIHLLYPELNNVTDQIVKTELARLIRLCEGSFSDDLENFMAKIKYLAKPRVEGRLVQKTNGRFCLDSYDNELTCGHRIEVFIEDENHDDYGWQFGRVEHSEKFDGYYFFNEGGDEHHKLTTGMLAAVRF